MTSPMTGPAWYWIAGTAALVLWAWVILGIPVAVLAGRWLRRRGGGPDEAYATLPSTDEKPAREDTLRKAMHLPYETGQERSGR